MGDSLALFFPTDDRPLKVHKTAFTARTQNFKVQPWLFQLSRDLADCAPVSHAVQLRAYRPLAPLNLRVQGDGHCPTYSTGQDIALTWNQSSPRTYRAGTAESGHAKRLECVCFSTAFAGHVTDHPVRRAAVNRTHSKRSATSPALGNTRACDHSTAAPPGRRQYRPLPRLAPENPRIVPRLRPSATRRRRRRRSMTAWSRRSRC